MFRSTLFKGPVEGIESFVRVTRAGLRGTIAATAGRKKFKVIKTVVKVR